MNELVKKTALELRDLIRGRKISAVAVVRAHLQRIAEVNGQINAVCTLAEESALTEAAAIDAALDQGRDPGPLAGLPVAVKDLVETRGIRTTFGSPIFRDYVPDQDELLVQRLRAAGAVILGKTNTPEFGAGSQTFNPVFGATRNPYDLGKTVGGSSGGAAAALASGMLPLADGSDLGGSLRNPASFCGVVGFRPSPGRVPRVPCFDLHDPLPVAGPMARTVTDAALLLSVLAGPDPRDPLSLDEPGTLFAQGLERNFAGSRLAWTPDLGDLAVERRVVDALSVVLPVFEQMGATVSMEEPDLPDAEETFLTLRSAMFAGKFHEMYAGKQRDLLKDTVVWNIEQGLKRDFPAYAQAQKGRARIFQNMLAFFRRFDFLLLPAAQVAPFPVEVEWVREIEGRHFDNYLQWMQVCCRISLTGCPAISVPAGFTPEGLPVGLQIVGPPRADLAVLQLAHAFQTANPIDGLL